jgi:hypothetical protein
MPVASPEPLAKAVAHSVNATAMEIAQRNTLLLMESSDVSGL